MRKLFLILVILVLSVMLLAGCGIVPDIPVTPTIDDFLGRWIVVSPCTSNVAEVTIYFQGQSDEYICFDFVLGIGPCEGVGWAGEITYSFLIKDCYDCDKGEACYNEQEGIITTIFDTTPDVFEYSTYELEGSLLKMTDYGSMVVGGEIMPPTSEVDYYKKAD